MLKNYGADINIKNQDGKTPLDLASNDLKEVLEGYYLLIIIYKNLLGRKDISEIKLFQPVIDIQALLSNLGENFLIPFKDAKCLEIIGKGNFGIVNNIIILLLKKIY